jgi:hypothetical protein
MHGEIIHGGKLYKVKPRYEPLAPDEMPCDFKSLKDVQLFFRYIMVDPFARDDVIEITKYFLPMRCGPYTNCPQPIQDEKLNALCMEILQGGLILVRKRCGELTAAEKEQCAKVYKIYTGEEIEASRWNRNTADILAEMVRDIEECSRDFGTVLACFPKSLPSKGEWLWLAEIVVDIIKNEALIRKGYVNTICLKTGVKKYEIKLKKKLL